MKTLEGRTSLHQLPGWVLGWFYATAAICTWDASFIVLRPHSLPGGTLHPLWKPYSMYIVVDRRYMDLDDPFVYGISLFNYAEVILNIITIFMHYTHNRHTIPLAFTVSTMTFWKTLFYLYAFTNLGGGAIYRVGNSAWEEFFLVLIPNGLWVLLPFIVMAALWSRIIPAQLPVPLADGVLYQNGKNENHLLKSSSSAREQVCHAKHA